MDATEHSVNSAVDIAPDGDVILLVGPEQTKLRVHSQCLRSASSVFNAMFGPNFREGQGLSSQTPREVPLPEDNPESIRIICCIIHHRNNDVPSALAAKDILQIAIAAEKFDLSIAFKYARAQWLKPQGGLGLLDMGYLMTAAYLFGDTDAFVANSLALILDYSRSYLELLRDGTISQFMPQKTFLLLEERRAIMRADLSTFIREGKNRACSCGWAQSSAQQYSLIEDEFGPLKMLEVPLSEIILRVKKVSTADLRQKRHIESGRSWLHEGLDIDEILLEKLAAAGRKASLCIDCVRSSRIRKCPNFQHE